MIPYVPSLQGSLQMASKKVPWQSFGPRLYRRGNAWYIRVQVPRDLKAAYGKGEICEPLKAGDRREAERLCRQRSAEIDRDLERKRKGPKDGPSSRDIDRVAQRFYQDEVASEGELVYDQMMRDPEMAGEALWQKFSPWADSLEGDAWSHQQNAFVREVLLAAGADLSPDHPSFPEARQKIVRAWLGVGQNLMHRTVGKVYQPDDPLLVSPIPPPVASTNGLTIATLIERYEQDRGGSWSSTTRDGYVLVFRALSEVLGPHTSIQSITRDDCRRIRSILTDLAPNYTRRAEMKGMAMEDAARVSRELDLPRRKPSSINVYVTNLTAILAYAETEDLIDKNPAKGLRLATKERARDRRNPFTVEQLQLIFGPRYGDPGLARGGGIERGGRHWVPLLSLFMGLRLNEACQLHVTDVRYVRDVPVIIVQEGEEGDGKSVKTSAGERTIPVHPELERLGFLVHWRAMERAGQVRLFPDLRLGTTGTYSDVFGQSFGRYLKRVGAYTARTTFHSLRHTWRDALRDAQVPGEIVRALGGWETGRDVSDDYGAGFTPERLYEAVRLVGYPGLDLGHLG